MFGNFIVPNMYHEQWSKDVFLFRAYSPHAPHNFEALFTKTAPSDTASIIYSRMLEHSAGDLTRIRKSSAACGSGSDTLNAPWILIRIWPILFPLRSTRCCFFFSMSRPQPLQVAVAFRIHQTLSSKGWSRRKQCHRYSHRINLSVAMCLQKRHYLHTVHVAGYVFFEWKRGALYWRCVGVRDYSVGRNTWMMMTERNAILVGVRRLVFYRQSWWKRALKFNQGKGGKERQAENTYEGCFIKFGTGMTFINNLSGFIA